MAARAPSLNRSIANRAVHVHIMPRPQNIVESREVLRLLSRFGEVEYFRNLRYDREPNPNTALAIFKDEQAAQYCLDKHQLRFRIGKIARAQNQDFETFEEPTFASPSPATTSSGSPTQPDHSRTDGAATPASTHAATPSTTTTKKATRPSPKGAFGLGQTRSLSTNHLPKPPRPPPSYPYGYGSSPIQPVPTYSGEQEHERDAQVKEEEPRVFQMFINAAKHDFMKHIEMGHYHGGFVNDWRSAVNDDLRKRTPLKGMANLDWRMKTKSATTIQRERAAIKDRLGGLGEIYRRAQQQAADDKAEDTLKKPFD